MFNKYDVNNSIKINAISGTIVKNYAKSFILRFHMKSQRADDLFSESPYLKLYGKERSVVVLQVMLCGEQELLAEVMWKSDFDELFNTAPMPHLEPDNCGNYVVQQEPKIGYCKDCKWWKDSNGAFRRGIGAESICRINTDIVYQGEGYCYLFEPQESEE